MTKIILASASPRRRELLTQVGISYEVIPSNADEDIDETNPTLFVEALSKRKALEVINRKDLANKQTGTLIAIGADTVVALEGNILGKPKDEKEAFMMLDSLQGRKHCVYTGVTLAKRTPDGTVTTNTFYEETAVEVVPMTKEDINNYIATNEPMDKAGAYGIQGAFAAYIKGIVGDYYNVVGLPICQIVQKLKSI